MAKLFSKKNKNSTFEEAENIQDAEKMGEYVPEQVERKKLNIDNDSLPRNDIPDEEYVSYVIPHRRLKKAARKLVRSNKMLLAAIIISIIILLLFAVSFMQENLGGFTINLNTVQMYRKGISLDTEDDFKNATSRLKIPSIKRGTNISVEDLNFDALKDIEGDASGMDYIAYGFYIKNGGIDPVNYTYKINCVTKAKGTEKAVRVALYANGKWTIYAKEKKDGTPEEGTEPFVSDSVILEDKVDEFKVGEINKYVVVMWIEGDDEDCTDDIIGGGIKLNMEFDTGKHEKVSLRDFFEHLPVFRTDYKAKK